MPLSLTNLCREIQTDRTAILFGAGSSMPSGAPTGQQLADYFDAQFTIGASGLSLIDVASLVELKHGRAALVKSLRNLLQPLRPTGGILNIPRYKWRDIFTTNFDQIIEKSFAKNSQQLSVISANYEFEKSYDQSQKLFKLHGTIEKDASDGDMSRIIITQEDYAISGQYRENLFDRFLITTSSSDLLIIGYSLADPDLMSIINESIRRKRETSSPGKIYVLSYERDDNRALLLEQRNIRVAFGGLDEFVGALGDEAPAHSPVVSTDDPLSFYPNLRPHTVDLEHASRFGRSDAARVFFGSPANYADILADLTFERDQISLIQNLLDSDDVTLIYVLGVAGVGKTTLCRQALLYLHRSGRRCWEHVDGVEFRANDWVGVAKKLAELGETAYLFVDNAHKHIRELSELVDNLSANSLRSLRIILATSSAHWNARTKTDNIFALGKKINLKKLSRAEIQRLLDLFDRSPAVSQLADRDFGGFSRPEKQRRLEQRCEADFFVCLKNIFSNDLLDTIVLKEFADLDPRFQAIYRLLAAMEASGVKLHRQIIIRLLGLPPQEIGTILSDLEGVIVENTLSEKLGIYAWSGRHIVISTIIKSAKYSDQNELMKLYSNFIDAANPTYEIERINLTELCGATGIGQISNREQQNRLYAQIISKAPTLRSPRHRLIGNLIRAGKFERASNEIKIFESDMRADAPLLRRKVELGLERARHTAGLLVEDRLALLREAAGQARKGLDRFEDDIRLHETFCEVGLQFMRFSADWVLIDEAIGRFRNRAGSVLNPEFARAMGRYTLKVQQIQSGSRG